MIPLAILDTVLRDIHGLPFLAGLIAGLLLDRHSSSQAGHGQRVNLETTLGGVP